MQDQRLEKYTTNLVLRRSTMFVNIAKCKTFSRNLDTPRYLAWIIHLNTFEHPRMNIEVLWNA
jgi:hypothetical protein